MSDFSQASVGCFALILIVIAVVAASILLLWWDLKKLADCHKGSPDQSRMYEEFIFAYGAFLPVYLPPHYLEHLEVAAHHVSDDQQVMINKPQKECEC